jgi:hypothetical protein
MILWGHMGGICPPACMLKKALRVRVRISVWSRVSVSKTVALLRFVTLRPAK